MNRNIRLFRYALRYKLSLFLGLAALGLAVLAQLYGPFLVRKIMDEEMLRTEIIMGNIIKLCGLYLAVVAFEALMQYLSGMQLRYTAMQIVSMLRMELYRKIHRMPLSYFDNTASGSIVSKISNDTEAVQGLYISVLGQVMISFCYIIGVHAALLWINPRFGAVVLILFPLCMAILVFYTKHTMAYNSFIRKKISELSASLNELVTGISIIQAFNKQKQMYEEFAKLSEDRYKMRKKQTLLNSLVTYNGTSFLRSLAIIVLVYYFGRVFLKSGSATSVGMLYVYIGYLSTLFMNWSRIIEQFWEMEQAGAAADSVFAVLDLKESGEAEGEESISSARGEVDISDVSFAYKEGEYVLREINIHADPGQTIGLVGHTGSGKSSVMNLLMKFYRPQKGKIRIDGIDLEKLDAKKLHEFMGIVLQEPFLFAGTVLSNITLEHEQIDREAAIAALKAVGGEELLHSLSEGIDTPVVERGATLSSGQRQLISFARALAHNPKILILDEATSSIDSQTEQTIQRAMEVLMKGRTTFVIAHRLSTIRNADCIYLLDKGRITESGNHDALIAQKGRYYEMYKAQSRG